MTLDEFLNHIEAGGALNTPEIYRLMDEMSDAARRITCEINNSYHSQEELHVLMSRLLGNRGGNIQDVSSVLHRFRQEYHHRAQCLHQRLLPFSGSWRRDIGRRLSHRA